MDPQEIPETASDIIWRPTDDGAVLVTPASGDVRVLNDVGATIWQLIDGERNVGEIESRLQEQFDIPRARLRADLNTFLQELSRRSLLRWK